MLRSISAQWNAEEIRLNTESCFDAKFTCWTRLPRKLKSVEWSIERLRSLDKLWNWWWTLSNQVKQSRSIERFWRTQGKKWNGFREVLIAKVYPVKDNYLWFQPFITIVVLMQNWSNVFSLTNDFGKLWKQMMLSKRNLDLKSFK